MTNREQECFYCIALSQIPRISIRSGKKLYDIIGSATEIFLHAKELPERITDLNPEIVKWLDCSSALSRADEEMNFIIKNNISFFTICDDGYPSRFKDCDDASLVLFLKGNADLNVKHIISVVGTRKATDYGKQFCNTFIRDLKAICPDIMIVSGLAYGIDICSHRVALDNSLSTVGVLAHGLDRIYPSIHRNTAVKMLENGGLLTEFISGTNPDPYNFVSRNRIVAGISDAVIVVESAAKGGSLITAEIAESYNRDCFALPGRIGDVYSVGSNQLIHDNKASLLFNAVDFVKAMGWDESNKIKEPIIQRNFFPDLNVEEQKVVRLLDERGNLQINILSVELGVPVFKMNSILFELEMKGIIRTMAGGMYQLLR